MGNVHIGVMQIGNGLRKWEGGAVTTKSMTMEIAAPIRNGVQEGGFGNNLTCQSKVPMPAERSVLICRGAVCDERYSVAVNVT